MNPIQETTTSAIETKSPKKAGAGRIVARVAAVIAGLLLTAVVAAVSYCTAASPPS